MLSAQFLVVVRYLNLMEMYGWSLNRILIQSIPNMRSALNLLMLALIPTIISNLALVQAIKSIGSTLTSILGAMEPVTAICVGIAVFHESLTYGILLGVAFIITAVTLLIIKR